MVLRALLMAKLFMQASSAAKKEEHGRFEDPYKMTCVCHLQASQPSLVSLFSLPLFLSHALSFSLSYA
jgi:hypothetical protein